jgi:TolA-binding protein
MMRILFPRLVCLWIIASLCAGPHARAQSLDQEFEFATKLVERGFPDFANKLMQQIVERHPDQRGRALMIKAEGLISQRKFNEAEAVISELPAGDPKADAIRLMLGRGYFRVGDVDRARALYQDFFNRFKELPTDPDLLKAYREAAYQFGQMLQQSGDMLGAADAMGKIIATKPGRDIERSMMAEQAQLLVDHAAKLSGAERDKVLAQAAKICADIQWGGVDLWFGHSIIALANIELVKGNRARAKELITRQYKDILREIDNLIKEQNLPAALNPNAGARFLLGQMYEQDAEAAARDPAKQEELVHALGRALNEYFNVFVRYGDTDWGPRAGIRANEIKTRLESMGRTVNVDLGAHAEKAASTQLRLADNLFREKKFAEAAAEYLRVVNAYPTAEASMRAMGFVIQSYIEMNDKLYARAMIEFTAERYAGRPAAALALLSAATLANNKKDAAFAVEIYEAYLRGFPKHERAGTILFFLGNERRKAGDNEGANYYFQRIVDNLPQDQYYPQALRLIARSYYDLGQFDKAAAAYAKLVADIPPSVDRAAAQFSLADSYLRMGEWSKAAAEFETLIRWLSPRDNPYAATEADRERNRGLLERAVFQRANAFARMTEPADQIPAFREAGMRGYEQFIKLFPQSEFAPRALMGQGQIQLSLGQFDAAARTFEQLASQYPQSEEGRNALFSLARSAMEIGQYDQARLAFEKMAANAAAYSPDEFARIGQLMIDAKLYDQALQAFRIVSENKQVQETKDTPASRALLERALFGVGSANFARKNYEEAVKALERLLQEYPRSGLFFEARFMLGEAYAELGNFLASSQSLSDIFRFSNDPIQINRASLKLAEVQLRANDKTGALASLQRVALLSDASKPEQRPFIEEALWRSIPLAMELERFKDALDSCDQYLQLYPTSDKVPEVRRLRAEAALRASAAAST